MTFLLDSDSAEVPGLPCDDDMASSMAASNHAMLSALNEARGVPAPVVAKAVERVRDYIFVGGSSSPDPNIFKSRFELVERLIDSVADDFDISHGELIGTARTTSFVHARAVVVRLLLDRGYSANNIGKRYLRRDHSSIINSRDNFDIYARVNPVVVYSHERHAAMMREAAL